MPRSSEDDPLPGGRKQGEGGWVGSQEGRVGGRPFDVFLSTLVPDARGKVKKSQLNAGRVAFEAAPSADPPARRAWDSGREAPYESAGTCSPRSWQDHPSPAAGDSSGRADAAAPAHGPPQP